jgi:hypothetical protein
MSMRRVLILGTLCLGVGALSCGLFEPRKPNRPPPLPSGCRSLTGGSVAIIANIEDDSVGYGRLGGLSCYSSMLDPSFIFHADPQDSSADPAPYIGWDQTVESRVNTSIASDQSFIEVLFLGEYANAIFPNSDTEIRFRDYQVRIQSKKQLSTPDTLRFAGLADLTFHRGIDGQWRITDWVDHRGASDSTWGYLRRQYRVGF